MLDIKNTLQILYRFTMLPYISASIGMIAFSYDAVAFVFSNRNDTYMFKLVREAIFDLNRSKYVNNVLYNNAFMEQL